MPSPPRSRRPAARLVALLICAGAIAAAQAWAQAPPPGPAPYQREGATDLTMKGLFPAFASPQSRSDTWLASLDEMERLKPRIVVGAHYDIGDASDIEAYRVYLKALRARAAELKKDGKSADKAGKTLVDEFRAGWAQPARVAAGAAAVYRELP